MRSSVTVSSYLRQRETTWTWAMTGVLVLAAVLFFARLGERALWSEEVRWAEIPREMILHDDYFHPTINGHSYYDKPLGSYFLVLLASRLTGGVDELAARLPSAVAGWLGVLLLMLLARRLYDSRVAAMAGLILTTSFSYLFFARLASTDVETVTGVLLALWLYQRSPTLSPGATVAIWIVMALTSLTKGLLGFVLPLLVIGLSATLNPTSERASGAPVCFHSRLCQLLQRNRWFFQRASLVAIPLAVLIYLLPFLISLAMTGSSEGLQMVFRENIRRFFAPVNHRGPVYLYGYIIFVLLAPWSVLLPAALGNANPRQSSDRFALVYFWGTFLFFTLASSRRSYYVLPILPAAALVIARLLTTESIRNRVVYGLMWTGHAVLGLSVLLGGIVLTLAPFIFGQWDFLQHVPARHLFVIALIGCFGALCWSLRMFGIARIRMALSVTAVVVMGYGYLVLWPFLDSLRTQKTFAQQVRSIPGLDLDHLTLFRNRDVVYYLGSAKPIRECYSAEALARKIQEAQIRWVIARQRDLATFTFPFKETVREVGHSWEEEARSGSKLILLEVQERQPPPGLAAPEEGCRDKVTQAKSCSDS